jgi:NADPH:quinone reductase-like Zn-dependent oxidoreductase
MVIAVEGTKNFSDYDVFMRAMGIALSTGTSDNKIQVWSLGPHKINSFTAAFCNSSERFLKNKGYKIVFHKVNAQWIAENIN